MKVAIINSVCGTGSTGEICVKLSEKLLDNKIDCKIFYGIGESNYNNSVKFSYTFDVKLHQLRTRVLGKHAFYSELSTYRLINMLKEYDPDIIHLHNLHGHYINVKLLFKFLSKSRKKIIWTFHDCWPYTGHCTHYTIAKCYKWKNGCKKCIQQKKYPISLFFDRSRKAWLEKRKIFLSCSNLYIVCVSNWLKNEVKKSFFKDKNEILSIFNSVDTNVFKPKNSDLKSKYNLNNKFIILGMYGKWTELINLSILDFLNSNLPLDAVIILIGKKDKKIETDKILTFDKITIRNELADFYNLADVFVNLSAEDSFGLVNIEALACGTPVIVYDSTASPEIVGRDEKCGYVVNIGDKFDLLYSILKIYKNGKNKYSKNCISRVKKFYDDKNNYNEYLDLYRRLIK